MPQIALGTKVFSRGHKLKKLVETLPDVFDAIYIADDGESTETKEQLYSHADIEMIDLEYDEGLSAGRNAIVERATEDYLCIVDTDHRVPKNVLTLVEQLESMEFIGGIGGILLEPEQNRIRFSGHDLTERNSNTLIRSPLLENKTIDLIAGSPYVAFDYIPNAAVFRREVLVDYPWDEEFTIEGEHLDYYINHWKNSEWEFGINPSVQFLHYPGGDTDYMSERQSIEKETTSKEYLLEKWGYNRIHVDSYDWTTVSGKKYADQSFPKTVFRTILEEGLKNTTKKIPQFVQNKYHKHRNPPW